MLQVRCLSHTEINYRPRGVQVTLQAYVAQGLPLFGFLNPIYRHTAGLPGWLMGPLQGPRVHSTTQAQKNANGHFKATHAVRELRAIPMFATHRCASVRVLAARLFAWLLREHFRKLLILDRTEYFVADKSFCW